MRIIAGSAGRMAIKVPHAVARPTTDFVRQAMFSILGERIIGARVADLFAGSGALGLEALSRGASSCTFVDESHQSVKVIRQNCITTRLQGHRIIHAEVLSFLKKDTQRYDLIFADPPYAKHPLDTENIGKILNSELLLPRLADDGIFYAEVAKSTNSPEHSQWNLIDRRHYGSSAILLYQPKTRDEAE
ncbi:MAG TPA: 16S rRNA (guanine(966)-N(2))-methyltransferase RsmD [Verrucomicrobiales bacterium]|nr:MAG: 16S rRNA (guanine(966)-N(2))-methyltransferase RsmD [Verrucomicrobiae bacterium Tous-C3TDCM]PAZ04190.1 MAG: 16S rRNA (guanine(966)-N(2))-methyltransferase RsmD [Verrucomicrobiae bacterium AMD-G2]HBE23372.1 16S rRNA (guanine(966)-N(2))-methyltransferase RsmD [Verrucomicrobiales bacterium]